MLFRTLLPSFSRGLTALAAVALSFSSARPALACATCSCGDPTLTLMGNEQPFVGRFRGSSELRYRSDDIGTPGEDQAELHEVRLDLGLAFAPIRKLNLSLSMPILWREASFVDLSRQSVMSPGDLELRGRWVAYRDRFFAPRFMAGLTFGIKWPTAPVARQADGTLYDLRVQPGTGSKDAILGGFLSYFKHPWSAYGSVMLYEAGDGHFGLEPGRSLRATVSAQYQPLKDLSLRLGSDGRLDARTEENDVVDPDSGGVMVFGTADVLYSPKSDLILRLGTALPVVQGLYGDHREGPMLTLGAVYDF
jgi:hypothetical protein